MRLDDEVIKSTKLQNMPDMSGDATLRGFSVMEKRQRGPLHKFIPAWDNTVATSTRKIKLFLGTKIWIEHENQMLESKDYRQLRTLSCLHQYVFPSYLEFFAFWGVFRVQTYRNKHPLIIRSQWPKSTIPTCHSQKGIREPWFLYHRGDHIPLRSVEAKNGGDFILHSLKTMKFKR